MSDMLLIRGGRVVNPQARRADPADVLIAGDTILEIGPPGLAAPDDATVIEAQQRLLMPGLVNAHTHSHANLPQRPHPQSRQPSAEGIAGRLSCT